MGCEHLHVESDADVTILRVLASDFLDDAVVAALSRGLTDVLKGARHAKVILDLSAITYYSSLLIGTVVSLHKKVAAAGGALHVCGLSRELARYLARISLDKLLDIFASEEEAKAAF